MGADSLVLLDAINTIKDRYGVAIPVRALFEELNTLDAVIGYVVEHAQPAASAAPLITRKPPSRRRSLPWPCRKPASRCLARFRI